MAENEYFTGSIPKPYDTSKSEFLGWSLEPLGHGNKTFEDLDNIEYVNVNEILITEDTVFYGIVVGKGFGTYKFTDDSGCSFIISFSGNFTYTYHSNEFFNKYFTGLTQLKIVFNSLKNIGVSYTASNVSSVSRIYLTYDFDNDCYLLHGNWNGSSFEYIFDLISYYSVGY